MSPFSKHFAQKSVYEVVLTSLFHFAILKVVFEGVESLAMHCVPVVGPTELLEATFDDGFNLILL